MTAKDRPFGHMFTAALAALTLAACAGGNDDAAARFLVAPGKYVLFNCQQLAQEATMNMTRQHDLEGLMAQAGTGAQGQPIPGPGAGSRPACGPGGEAGGAGRG